MNRRAFIKSSMMTAGAVMLADYSRLASAASHSGKEPVSDQSVKWMDFKVSYVTEIINPPKEGRSDIWIPLPMSDQEQDVTSLNINSTLPFNINQEPVYGNRMVYASAEKVKAGDNLSLTYNVRRKTSKIVVDDDDPKKHLVLTAREKWDDDITKFVDSVVGKEKDPLEIGRKVYNALVETLTYDKKIPGCGQGISAWTFQNKRGRCDDFHALFRTMMVRKGVPVRWEQGIPLPYPSVMTKKGELEGDCTGAHCWVRFYIGDGKWVPVDVSEANKRKDLREYFFGTLSPNRFKVSTGRDLVLAPKQGYEPLNNFPYAYAEADGLPMVYGHQYKNTIRFEVTNIEV